MFTYSAGGEFRAFDWVRCSIVSDHGAVVMIAESYWESIQETLRLLQDTRSLKALLEGHHLRATGHPIQAKTPDEAFSDLQN
ncbi:MAG: hypothetical protein R3A44_01640 [Caldilineaceae bacterium]